MVDKPPLVIDLGQWRCRLGSYGAQCGAVVLIRACAFAERVGQSTPGREWCLRRRAVAFVAAVTAVPSPWAQRGVKSTQRVMIFAFAPDTWWGTRSWRRRPPRRGWWRAGSMTAACRTTWSSWCACMPTILRAASRGLVSDQSLLTVRCARAGKHLRLRLLQCGRLRAAGLLTRGVEPPSDADRAAWCPEHDVSGAKTRRELANHAPDPPHAPAAPE